MGINPNCSVIGVIGGKGGVGKSVFAANLAFATTLELRTPSLLIDLDSKSCGDQNFLTGFQKPKTIGELCQFTGSLTPRNLSTVMNIHSQAPVHYLAATKTPSDTFNPPPAIVQKQLESLSNFYKYIILDLGNSLEDVQRCALEVSTLVLLVTNPDILTINQTLRLGNELAAATLPSAMIQIVVNKYSKAGLGIQAIEKTMRKKIIGLVPQDDLTAMASLKRSTPGVLLNKNSPFAAAFKDIVRRLSGGVLQKLKAMQKSSGGLSLNETSSNSLSDSSALNSSNNDPKTLLKLKIHKRLVKELNLKNDDIEEAKNDPQKDQKLKNDVRAGISRILEQEARGIGTNERRQVIKEVMDEALGLGPLEELLAMDSVSEIMVNGYDKIFIEKSGKIQLSKIYFTSNVQLRNVIERIVTPLGRQINEKTPYVDARLHDGSRVNAIIEPLAIDGPALTIRKFKKDAFGVEDYIRFQSATKNMIDFLKLAVHHGKNIIISGGTGSGKTTLLNCMSSFIPPSERVITIEDAAELQLKQEHVVRLETRPANIEGTGAISIRDLVKNSLRMRPDRIVVGECRDGAALDMLSAMGTGHDGSMTTVHSNNSREAIGRLQNLCLMAGMDLPAEAIKKQIASSVDLIVQISRLSDGSRKILQITEVQGLTGNVVTLSDIFTFEQTGFDRKTQKVIGEFRSQGRMPKFVEDLKARGFNISGEMFSNKTATPPSTPASGIKPRPQKLRKKVSGGR